MITTFKLLASWKLANKYGLSKWDILLPTGCDCILEGVFKKEGVLDEYGCEIEIVHENITYILGMAIPMVGIAIFLFRLVWRYKILYQYLVPTLHPDMSDWDRLIYCIIPSIYYFKVWREF